VPTLEGEQSLRFPEGTQSGTTFRLKNKGVPVLNGRGKGDLFVEVRAQTPSKLTASTRTASGTRRLTRVENKPERSTLVEKMKDHLWLDGVASASRVARVVPLAVRRLAASPKTNDPPPLDR